MADKIFDTIRPGLTDLHAVQFAGGVASSHIDSINSASLDITSAGTIECWFIPTGSVAILQQLAGQGNTSNQGFFLYINGSRLVARVGNGTTSALPTGTTVLVPGTLYHACVTYDVADAGGTVRLYLNGVEEVNAALSTGISLPAANKVFSAGGIFSDSTASRHIAAKVDNVRLYSRAITPAEVVAHMAGTFSNNSNLLIDWRCDNGIGIAVADHSGNNFHGTFANTAGVVITWIDRLVNF